MKKQNSLEKLVSLMFATNRLIRENGYRRERIDPTTILQMETLRYVEDRGVPSMKDVATYLSIAPPSATSLIEHLAKTKLLARSEDPKDRRITRLSITPRGHTTLIKNQKRVGNHLKTVFRKLDEKERNHLIAILEKISKSYQ